MVSLNSLFLITLCSVAYAAPHAPAQPFEVSLPAPRAVEAFDGSLAEKRSESLPEGSVTDLVPRHISSGSFNLQWVAHLDEAKDVILKAIVSYAEGQVYAAAGTGVYASPFSGTGNGQGVFRVSYLSSSGVWTAVARILFDTVTGVIINMVDEGVEQNGSEIKSNFYADFTSA